jgi:hypothetical protein
MSSQHDPSEPFRLPDSLASLGDPVEGNPFPLDSPQHQAWISATRTAEEEVCRITSSVLSNLTASTGQDWPATLIIIARFDAWARRGASIVWSDRAVQHYDQWLVSSANASLAEAARGPTSAPSSDSVDGSLTDLRNRLGAQVHSWKAVARRVCAERQPAQASHEEPPPDVALSRFFEMFLGKSFLPQNDPGHQQWIDTSRHLADELTRIDSAFWSAEATPADAAMLVESLARWTAACFDAMAEARLNVVVKDKSAAGEAAYRDLLNGLRAQALKAADALQARVSAHARTLIAAFPGPTVSNTACAAFAAEVNERLIPAVTEQVFRRKAQRWVQACEIARGGHDGMFAREAPTSLDQPRPAETAAGETAAPRPDSPHEPAAPPAQDSMSARGWEDVEIRLLSDFTFQAVINGTIRPPQNYADVGFGDARHGRPKAAWETLRALAESGGVIASTRTAADWRKLEKRIQEIRKLLRACFALTGDPVPFVKGGYRTRFKIGVSASYER